MPASGFGSWSWSSMYPGGFEYCTQLPDARGAKDTGFESRLVMLGGGLFRSKNKAVEQIGIWEDRKDNMDPMVITHLRDILPALLFSPEGTQGETGESSNVTQDCGTFAQA